MSTTVNADAPVSKLSPKLKKAQRVQVAVALKASGMQIQHIAAELGVDRKSVQRYTQDSDATEVVVKTALQKLNEEIDLLLPVQEKAKKYVELAVSAKNEAVSLGALQRIDDLSGIVTEKELVRSKRNEPASPQAMFAIAPGCSVSVSVTTTASRAATQQDNILNVTPIDPS